ncbi:MAG: RNA polymerase sigma-70 factor [Bacteroidales bacterium]
MTMTPMTKLMELIRNGDEHAFHELFRKYSYRLQRFAYDYVGDIDDAMDIIQNVYLTFWEKREHLSTDTNPEAYLLVLTRNACIDHLRKAKVRYTYMNMTQDTLSLEQSLNLSALEAMNPDSLEIKDLKKLISDTIAAMSPESREVFLLSRKDQLKYTEISERLHISVRTVERRMGVALAAFRKNLKEHYFLLPFFL